MASIRPKPERKLPIQQLLVLGLARFAEPVALTSVFPYLPEVIESLDVAPTEVAYYAGITASVFSLSQAVCGVPWGRISDLYGRKPVLIFGLFSTMVTSIVWGFSRTLWMAILVRSLQGAGNGNVGIIRTVVAELVPYKELQPRAFSVMPLIWNIGSIFGPALGGALANPEGIKPGQALPENAGLLERFPYALPNLVSALLFLVGITTAVLFLDVSACFTYSPLRHHKSEQHVLIEIRNHTRHESTSETTAEKWARSSLSQQQSYTTVLKTRYWDEKDRSTKD